ncbi:putative bifunctional diguanylate cyclase/phosphodiesterase [Thetidibacter halocola]|uniref:EAL domain-containing protein n=1 Tax=Thetidibacter halocola TaxID=2827239 RepID=A0A8J8B7Q5_9RHOB|nr:EAL domain-containing protein [Thetidibacter halocola]MBS0123949.1 EAL domain-containing protein [Thetidibacter halocola]
MTTLATLFGLHDLRFVAVAGLLCAVAGAVAQPILGRARTAAPGVSPFWILCFGVIVGSSIWSVHFIAMLGYAPAEPLGYRPDMTGLSLLVSVAGMTAMAAAARMPGVRREQAAQTLLFLVSVSAMHHLGMAGLVAAAPLHHAQSGVALSVLLAAPCALLFVVPSIGLRPRHCAIRRGGAFTLTILLIHFGGMAALHRGTGAAPLPDGLLTGAGLIWVVLPVTGLILLAGAAMLFLERRNSEIFERRRLENRLIDPDLMLPNRDGMIAEMAGRMVEGRPFLLLALSLGGFREARMLFGRDVLRQWLPRLARPIQQAAGAESIVGHAGAGHFLVLLDRGGRQDGPALWKERAQALRREIGQIRLAHDGQGLTLEPVIGLAAFPEHGDRPHDLADHADFALDGAVEATTTDCALFDRHKLAERQRTDRLALDLRGAIRDGGLALHLQPQVSFAVGPGPDRVTGFEALARWTHPEFGAVSPAVFVPLADRNGLTADLARWALTTACTELAAWPGAHTVAVNVPPALLERDLLLPMVRAALGRSGLAPCRLEIEVTETGIIADMDRARACIAELRAMGVRVSLDDFGTGSASLLTLFEIPLDKVKLDQTFVRGCESDPRSRAIVDSAAFVARRLGIALLAEGVETEAQMAVLRQGGFDAVQGYLIAPPLPPEVARARYARNRATGTG